MEKVEERERITAVDSEDTDDRGQDDSEALFRLLTEEIKDLNEAERLRGWTPWIVSATLISMVWLAVADLWIRHPPAESIRMTFIAISLAIWLLHTVRVILEELSQSDKDTRFLLVHTSGKAVHVFAFAAWWATISAAIWTYKDIEARYIQVGVGILTSLFTLSALLAVLTIVTRLPFPVPKRFSVSTIVLGLVVIVFYGLAIAQIVQSASFANADVLDLRAGGILALAAYAFLQLSRGSGQPALRTTLSELRRDLVLGALPLEEAQRRTRATLQGVWLSDIARDDVQTLLKLISNVRSLYEDAFRKIETLNASVPLDSASGKHLKEFEKLAVSNTLDVLKTYEPRVSEISHEYFAKLRSLERRMQLVARIVRGTSSEKDKVLSEVEEAQRQADIDQVNFARRYYELQNAWNRWYPDEARQHKPFGASVTDPALLQHTSL